MDLDKWMVHVKVGDDVCMWYSGMRMKLRARRLRGD